MYHAKEAGRGQFQVFDLQLHVKIRELHQLETDLRKSIDGDAFELHYQPIVSLDSGAVIGFEALIRWNHPTRGLIQPDTTYYWQVVEVSNRGVAESEVFSFTSYNGPT